MTVPKLVYVVICCLYAQYVNCNEGNPRSLDETKQEPMYDKLEALNYRDLTKVTRKVDYSKSQRFLNKTRGYDSDVKNYLQNKLAQTTRRPCCFPRRGNTSLRCKCSLWYFYNEKNDRCERMLGGGAFVAKHYNRTCNSSSPVPYNNNPNFYFFCINNSTVIGQCPKYHHLTKEGICKRVPTNIKRQPIDKAIVCKEPGKFAHPYNQSYYYMCNKRNNTFSVVFYRCPNGTVFNSTVGWCLKPLISSVPETGISHLRCLSPGKFGIGSNCSQYYTCEQLDKRTYKKTLYSCPPGRFFSIDHKYCVPWRIAICAKDLMDYFPKFYDHSETTSVTLKTDTSISELGRTEISMEESKLIQTETPLKSTYKTRSVTGNTVDITPLSSSKGDTELLISKEKFPITEYYSRSSLNTTVLESPITEPAILEGKEIIIKIKNESTITEVNETSISKVIDEKVEIVSTDIASELITQKIDFTIPDPKESEMPAQQKATEISIEGQPHTTESILTTMEIKLFTTSKHPLDKFPTQSEKGMISNVTQPITSSTNSNVSVEEKHTSKMHKELASTTGMSPSDLKFTLKVKTDSDFKEITTTEQTMRENMTTKITVFPPEYSLQVKDTSEKHTTDSEILSVSTSKVLPATGIATITTQSHEAMTKLGELSTEVKLPKLPIAHSEVFLTNIDFFTVSTSNETATDSVKKTESEKTTTFISSETYSSSPKLPYKSSVHEESGLILSHSPQILKTSTAISDSTHIHNTSKSKFVDKLTTESMYSSSDKTHLSAISGDETTLPTTAVKHRVTVDIPMNVTIGNVSLTGFEGSLKTETTDALSTEAVTSKILITKMPQSKSTERKDITKLDTMEASTKKFDKTLASSKDLRSSPVSDHTVTKASVFHNITTYVEKQESVKTVSLPDFSLKTAESMSSYSELISTIGSYDLREQNVTSADLPTLTIKLQEKSTPLIKIPEHTTSAFSVPNIFTFSSSTKSDGIVKITDVSTLISSEAQPNYSTTHLVSESESGLLTKQEIISSQSPPIIAGSTIVNVTSFKFDKTIITSTELSPKSITATRIAMSEPAITESSITKFPFELGESTTIPYSSSEPAQDSSKSNLTESIPASTMKHTGNASTTDLPTMRTAKPSSTISKILPSSKVSRKDDEIFIPYKTTQVHTIMTEPELNYNFTNTTNISETTVETGTEIHSWKPDTKEITTLLPPDQSSISNQTKLLASSTLTFTLSKTQPYTEAVRNDSHTSTTHLPVSSTSSIHLTDIHTSPKHQIETLPSAHTEIKEEPITSEGLSVSTDKVVPTESLFLASKSSTPFIDRFSLDNVTTEIQFQPSLTSKGQAVDNITDEELLKYTTKGMEGVAYTTTLIPDIDVDKGLIVSISPTVISSTQSDISTIKGYLDSRSSTMKETTKSKIGTDFSSMKSSAMEATVTLSTSDQSYSFPSDKSPATLFTSIDHKLSTISLDMSDQTTSSFIRKSITTNITSSSVQKEREVSSSQPIHQSVTPVKIGEISTVSLVPTALMPLTKIVQAPLTVSTLASDLTPGNVTALLEISTSAKDLFEVGDNVTDKSKLITTKETLVSAILSAEDHKSEVVSAATGSHTIVSMTSSGSRKPTRESNTQPSLIEGYKSEQTTHSEPTVSDSDEHMPYIKEEIIVSIINDSTVIETSKTSMNDTVDEHLKISKETSKTEALPSSTIPEEKGMRTTELSFSKYFTTGQTTPKLPNTTETANIPTATSQMHLSESTVLPTEMTSSHTLQVTTNVFKGTSIDQNILDTSSFPAFKSNITITSSNTESSMTEIKIMLSTPEEPAKSKTNFSSSMSPTLHTNFTTFENSKTSATSEFISIGNTTETDLILATTTPKERLIKPSTKGIQEVLSTMSQSSLSSSETEVTNETSHSPYSTFSEDRTSTNYINSTFPLSYHSSEPSHVVVSTPEEVRLTTEILAWKSDSTTLGIVPSTESTLLTKEAIGKAISQLPTVNLTTETLVPTSESAILTKRIVTAIDSTEATTEKGVSHQASTLTESSTKRIPSTFDSSHLLSSTEAYVESNATFPINIHTGLSTSTPQAELKTEVEVITSKPDQKELTDSSTALTHHFLEKNDTVKPRSTEVAKEVTSTTINIHSSNVTDNLLEKTQEIPSTTQPGVFTTTGHYKGSFAQVIPLNTTVVESRTTPSKQNYSTTPTVEKLTSTELHITNESSTQVTKQIQSSAEISTSSTSERSVTTEVPIKTEKGIVSTKYPFTTYFSILSSVSDHQSLFTLFPSTQKTSDLYPGTSIPVSTLVKRPLPAQLYTTVSYPEFSSTTVMPDFALECEAEGTFRVPLNCDLYYHCMWDHGFKNFITSEIMKCPGCMKFNVQTGECDNIHNVPECALLNEIQGECNCTTTGHFSVPDSCNKYYECSYDANRNLVRYIQNCPMGQHFDPFTEQCHPAESVSSCGNTDYMVCTKPGFFPHPFDCTRFYQCVYYQDTATYELLNYFCPHGMEYDVVGGYCKEAFNRRKR